MAYADAPSKKKKQDVDYETVKIPRGDGKTYNTFKYKEVNERIVEGTATGPDYKKPRHFHGDDGAQAALKQAHIEMPTEFGRDKPKKWTKEQGDLLVPFFRRTAGDKFTRVAADLRIELDEASRHITKYKEERPVGTSKQMGTTREDRVHIMEALAAGKSQTVMVGSGVLDQLAPEHRRDISKSDRDVSSSRSAMSKQKEMLTDKLGRRFPLAHDHLKDKGNKQGFALNDKSGEHLIGFHNIAGHQEVKGRPVRSIAKKDVWVQTPTNFIETKMYRTFGSGEEAKAQAEFVYNPHTRKTTAKLTGDKKQRNDLLDSRDMARFIVRNARRTGHKEVARDWSEIANGFDFMAKRVGKKKR